MPQHLAPAPAWLRLPAELLEAAAAPAPAAAKKVLEAHRILVTARSLRSVDSSASRASDATDAHGGGAAGPRDAADVEQAKCLLLKAMAAALPLLEGAGKRATARLARFAALLLG